MNLLVVTADLMGLSGTRSSLSVLHLFNHLQHALCAIGGRGVFDGGGQFVALRPRLHQGVGQGLRGHVFLQENMAESAFFKALGVENLVAAAGALGVRDKQQRTV